MSFASRAFPRCNIFHCCPNRSDGWWGRRQTGLIVRYAGSWLIAPVVAFSKISLECLDKTKIYEYYFLWGEKLDVPALVLGYGSLFNHSDDPNAEFSLDIESENMHFSALKDISTGTEITTNYRAGRPDQPLWFDVKS